MLNHGIPVIVISRRLGHAKPSITLNVYGHLIPSMQAEAAQKIDELITPLEFFHLNPTAPELHQDAINLWAPPHPAVKNQKPPQSGGFEWAEQDSNLRPPLCKRGALTD